MERESVLRWFSQHPGAVHGNPEVMVRRCERAVRRHARERMWLAARDYAHRRRLEWEHFVGAHASEAYTAREVCHDIAHGLRHHEPHFGRSDADLLAGGPVRDAVEPEGWEFLVRWIVDLAEEEGHEVWGQIVRYTDARARELIREEHLSNDCSLARSGCYGEIASRIADLLEHDYAVHAFPH